MYVKNIVWLDEDIKEAEVNLSDGKFELVCFSDEFFGGIGDEFDEMLYAIVDSDFVKNEASTYDMKHLDGFNYFIVAKLVDKKEGIVQLGQFRIDVGQDFPKDISDGEFIEFQAGRLDIY